MGRWIRGNAQKTLTFTKFYIRFCQLKIIMTTAEIYKSQQLIYKSILEESKTK